MNWNFHTFKNETNSNMLVYENGFKLDALE